MKNKPKNNLIEDIQDSKISNLNPIQRKSHVSFKKLEKTKISNLTVIEKHNSNSSDISYQKIENSKTNFKKNIFIPKPQLRIIKVPGFCSDFVCKKDTFYTIKQVHSNYKEIQFLLDIVHYLKSQNEINIIEKYFFNEEQRKALSYTYSFEADFALEREGYEYMIKHNKNKFDDKESNETNSQNHLIISKK